MTLERRPTLTLAVPSQTSFLSLVSDLTRQVAAQAGFEEATCGRLALAVDEAATNAIEHAYGGAPDREVRVRFEDTDDALAIELEDDGATVDPGSVPAVDIDRFVSERRTGGLGVHLMGKIMDSVTYARDGRANVCRLVKHKAPAAAADPSPAALSDEHRATLLELWRRVAGGESGAAALDAGLAELMRALGVRAGCVLARVGEGMEVRAQRGLDGGPRTVAGAGPVERAAYGASAAEQLAGAAWVRALQPIARGGRAIGALALGARAAAGTFGPGEAALLEAAAASLSLALENALLEEELRQIGRRLSLASFQLHNLFDITRELAASQDENGIKGLVTTAVMGQLMVSRCVLYLRDGDELVVAQERGMRMEEEGRRIPQAAAEATLQALAGARPVAELPENPLRARLLGHRLALAVPLSLGARAHGLLAMGERASGAPFAEEDRDFAFALGRQALVALESVRLNRIRAEKERQDRELQFAREIQRSLFPVAPPVVEGFTLAAVSVPSQEVGGDHYDFIPLPGGRVALTVADVSGKGTPASLLMASVHASLRALAGTLPPAQLMERLSRFLYDSTQAHRYVTIFYAELDPATRTLVYVNGGHVPPCLLRPDGEEVRLTCGGPVLGLIEIAPGAFEVGTVRLGRGDLLALVTDGVTEASSPEEAEYGERRLFETLRAVGRADAEETLGAIVDSVHAWTGPAGSGDDLTAVVLRAH
ncbi:MAG: SpoIIE family protein phosphatase [Vicinamibacteria bacterium]